MNCSTLDTAFYCWSLCLCTPWTPWKDFSNYQISSKNVAIGGISLALNSSNVVSGLLIWVYQPSNTTCLTRFTRRPASFRPSNSPRIGARSRSFLASQQSSGIIRYSICGGVLTCRFSKASNQGAEQKIQTGVKYSKKKQASQFDAYIFRRFSTAP